MVVVAILLDVPRSTGRMGATTLGLDQLLLGDPALLLPGVRSPGQDDVFFFVFMGHCINSPMAQSMMSWSNVSRSSASVNHSAPSSFQRHLFPFVRCTYPCSRSWATRNPTSSRRALR